MKKKVKIVKKVKMSKKCANVRVLAGVEQYIRAGQLQERMEGRKKDFKREG